MRKPAYTLEQLRSFVAVAETEHISRAAASLYLTQGAVTQQVRHFERAVGLQLLERDGRRVRLTDAGRALAEACRAALRSVEVMDDTAQAMKELQAGSLHVGASPTCATYYLPPHLAEFTRRHPGIKLNVLVEPSAELNRRVFAAYGWGEIVLGTVLLWILNRQNPRDAVSLALAGALLSIAVTLGLIVTPQIAELGRTLDFIPRNPPPPGFAQFRSLHRSYAIIETTKFVLGMALLGRWLLTR